MFLQISNLLKANLISNLQCFTWVDTAVFLQALVRHRENHTGTCQSVSCSASVVHM